MYWFPQYVFTAYNLYTRLLSTGDTRANKTSLASILVGDREDPNNGSSSLARIEWQGNTGLSDKIYGALEEGKTGEPMMVSRPLIIGTLENNDFEVKSSAPGATGIHSFMWAV